MLGMILGIYWNRYLNKIFQIQFSPFKTWSRYDRERKFQKLTRNLTGSPLKLPGILVLKHRPLSSNRCTFARSLKFFSKLGNPKKSTISILSDNFWRLARSTSLRSLTRRLRGLSLQVHELCRRENICEWFRQISIDALALKNIHSLSSVCDIIFSIALFSCFLLSETIRRRVCKIPAVQWRIAVCISSDFIWFLIGLVIFPPLSLC